MKGVILAAGSGEELKPFTDITSKPLVKILDKTLIEYPLERLIHNGIDEIYIVVNENDTKIKTYLGKGEKYGITIKYCEQPISSPGIDGAILSIKKVISDDEAFILTHCDIICNDGIVKRTLNAFDNTGADMAIAVALQSEIQDFGVVEIDSNGFIAKVIPENQKSQGNYVVAGTFILTSKIFKYLEKSIPFNLAFNELIKDKIQIATAIWNETWIDIGRPWDLIRASNYLLEKMEISKISSNAYIEYNVEINGPVIIESGAEILNGSIIKGPVYIGKNAFIGNNSLIRDHSVIGDNAKIGMGVEIKNSIIQDGASIARLSYIGKSVIGEKSTIHSGVITVILDPKVKTIKSYVNGKDVVVPFDKFGAIIGPNSYVGVHVTLMPGTRVDTGYILNPHKIYSGYINE